LIRLTRIKGEEFILNSDLIEHVEAIPDTVIALVNGQRFRVVETPDEVVSRVIAFRRALQRPGGARFVLPPREALTSVRSED